MLISQLPEEYRELAKQRRKEWYKETKEDMEEDDEELALAFTWSAIPEGHSFWADLCYHIPIHPEDNDGIFK